MQRHCCHCWCNRLFVAILGITVTVIADVLIVLLSLSLSLSALIFSILFVVFLSFMHGTVYIMFTMLFVECLLASGNVHILLLGAVHFFT